jgi:probable rRNA maturation factor
MITIEPPGSVSLSKSGLMRFLNRARDAAGLTGEVHVLLTTDAELKRLNRTYRGKNKPTDILSFPAEPSFAGNRGLAGDLAISLDTAARQAAAHGHTLRDEIRILLLHGTLHLAGFDHEADRGEMAARETGLRRELRLPGSLIERGSRVSNSPGRSSPGRKAGPRR